MSKKVLVDWPAELRDDAQVLDPLPEDRDTQYIIIRIQSDRLRNLQFFKACVDLVRSFDGPQSSVSLVSTQQTTNRWQPRNSFPVTRGLFDWMYRFAKTVAAGDQARIEDQKALRDERRSKRASA